MILIVMQQQKQKLNYRRVAKKHRSCSHISALCSRLQTMNSIWRYV